MAKSRRTAMCFPTRISSARRTVSSKSRCNQRRQAGLQRPHARAVRRSVPCDREDRDNRVVILTGGGDAFMDTIDPKASISSRRRVRQDPARGPQGAHEHPRHRGAMIAALNGPVLLHSEYALLTDIVVATPETVSRTSRISISASFPATASPLVARGDRLDPRPLFHPDAAKARRQTAKIGAWSTKSCPPSGCSPARTRSHQIAALPPLTGRYTRIALTQKLRRIIDEGVVTAWRSKGSAPPTSPGACGEELIRCSRLRLFHAE